MQGFPLGADFHTSVPVYLLNGNNHTHRVKRVANLNQVTFDRICTLALSQPGPKDFTLQHVQNSSEDLESSRELVLQGQTADVNWTPTCSSQKYYSHYTKNRTFQMLFEQQTWKEKKRNQLLAEFFHGSSGDKSF